MTVIEFVPDERYGFSAFRVSGHSGYADEGSDIVCAYISSATDLALSLLCDFYEISADVDVSSKDATVKCVINETSGNQSKAEDIKRILTAFHDQLRELCKEYPKNAKISERKILL